MYYALDEKTVVDYVQKSPVMATILVDCNDLVGADLAEGNVNLVFRVYSLGDPEKSVILKQALPYARK